MALIETAIGIVIGFFMGIFLNEKIKEFIFYKYFWSPIEISSDDIFWDMSSDDVLVLQKDFEDVILICNRTEDIIRINKLGIKIEIVERENKDAIFSVSWGKCKKSAEAVSSTEPISVEIYPPELFPFILKPKGHKKIPFKILLKSAKEDEVRTKVTIIPHYRYKKPKIEFNIIFKK